MHEVLEPSHRDRRWTEEEDEAAIGLRYYMNFSIWRFEGEYSAPTSFNELLKKLSDEQHWVLFASNKVI